MLQLYYDFIMSEFQSLNNHRRLSNSTWVDHNKSQIDDNSSNLKLKMDRFIFILSNRENGSPKDKASQKRLKFQYHLCFTGDTTKNDRVSRLIYI